jgi:predicted TIM-barrel fold metal-dependent hydrolase
VKQNSHKELSVARLRIFQAAIAASVVILCGQSYAADKLPFKLFDTHTHFVSDDFQRYPLSSQATGGQTPVAQGQAGAGAQAGSGVPDRYRNGTPSAEKVFSWWDANGVEAGVGVQFRTAYGTNNAYLLDLADKYPNRVAPVVILDASDPKTPDQLRSMVKAHGASGIRLTGSGDTTQWLDSPAALGTWTVANELGLAVVVMVMPTGVAKGDEVIPPSPLVLDHVAQLADEYPNVKIALDHFGWPAQEGAPNYGFTAAHLALKAHRNVYYKFTTINLNNLKKAGLSAPDFVRHAVDLYGADHIMWGSDIGNSGNSAGEYQDMVSRAIDATQKLNPREQKQMLRDTGRSVFVRGGRGAGKSNIAVSVSKQ